MIVYGDPQFSQTLPQVVARLRERTSHLARSVPHLDDLRVLLVQVGQLEQAVHDALPQFVALLDAAPWIERCQICTDLAATAFYVQWQTTQSETSPNDSATWLQCLAQELESWPRCDINLNVKLPEGFAFYTLFPEQYAASALRWMDEHKTENSQRVAVIGIRSIGTSLSALIKVALQRNGWEAQRLTVRPTGHPFERQVRLEKDDLGGAEWFLVVDEGPGLSGSSMAGVAHALHGCSIARERIVFLPGHGGEPGEQASLSTRYWWDTTARYVTPLNAMRWHEQSLPQVLAQRTRELLNTDEQVVRIEDLSGGLWRAIEYSNETQGPPITTQFERTKYCCTLNDGCAVLWKFAGFVSLVDGSATDETQRELTKRAIGGFTVSPLGSCCGFVATPWIEGRPLAREDMTSELLAHVGRYIATSYGAPLSLEEAQTSRQRLAEMLVCNTREALGDEAAERARTWSEKAKTDESAPTYGDGHLAPHEWIRTPDHRVLKTDCCGHDWDHTVVGRQSWLWDVAGAIVEWNLDEKSAEPLLNALIDALTSTRHEAANISRDALRFYSLSYAAFRLGLCAMSAQNASHQDATAFYLQRLQRGLYDDFEYSIVR